MTLSEVCVRRPVFATMLVSAAVAFGLLSFGKLGVDQYPNVELPVVTVTTVLRGASPEEIETQVTKIIEDAVSTCEGIDELRSTSREGISSVTVEFVLDRERDQATQDVRDKVAAALRLLPDDTDPPVVTKFDTTAIPVMTVSVSGKRELREVTEIARQNVLEPLQGVRGVGQIQVVGGRLRALNVFVDADTLIAQGLSIDEVRQAIQQQNVEVPAGRVTRVGREDVLRTLARVENVDELRRLVIAEREGAPVTLGQIARVEDAEEEPRSLSRLDGIPAVSLIIQKQAGTNTVEVVDNVVKRLHDIEAGIPHDIHISILRDQSTFIRRSIHEVELHLVLGAVLASLAVLLFMGSLRSTFIAAIAIPSSIIATFAILRALDYTLNNFTLLALTLSVGIVIDDAIVVLENIHRHVEEGETPFDAAIRGTKEITLAVMATTLSLIVIFLPTAFMEGRVGQFWRSFGVTVAFAIAVSFFIALTLTPMLCSRLLRPAKHGSGLAGFSQRLTKRIDVVYGHLVRWSLGHRWVVVIVAVLTVAMVVPLAGAVPKDFIPLDDTSDFNVLMVMPEGSDLSASTQVADEVERRLRTLTGVEQIFTTIGSTTGGDDVTDVQIYVKIVDITKRGYPLGKVMGEARKLLAPYADLRPAVTAINSFRGGRGGQFSFALRGPDLDRLGEIATGLMARMREVPGLVDVDSSAAVRKPEIRVKVDRMRAADLGVRAEDVAAALRTMVGGEQVSKFREGDEQYDVWLRLEPEDRDALDKLKRLPIHTRAGTLARLDTIADLSQDRGPAQVDRLNRVRQIEMTANLDGLALGDAAARVQAMVKGMKLPPGYELVFGGRAKLLGETFRGFGIALLLSFLFMYMVLAAQFESFLHPITIMLSLPLALPFALLSLILMNDTLNLYSAFGVFMLFGIVKKNGILQVDYTNVLRSRGMERNAAIIQANITRLRPILMTTVTLICGMIPIATGKGPGAASRATMANVIIGGQAMSLIITLLIVPVAYSLFDDATRGIVRALAWLRGSRGPAENRDSRAPAE